MPGTVPAIERRSAVQLSPTVSKALDAFRLLEGAGRRGPRFVDVATAFEQEIHQPGVTEIVILDTLGPPDIRRPGLFVYFFDHEKAGCERDEWYFIFENGKLFNSGYNRHGINSFPDDGPPSAPPT